MIYSGDLKEVVEKSSEFENSANLKEGSIFNCPIPYIWFDLDEVIEKNAEFENSDVLLRKQANLSVYLFGQRNPFATDMIYSGD